MQRTPKQLQETIFALSEIVVSLKLDRVALEDEVRAKNSLIRDLARQLEECKTRLRERDKVNTQLRHTVTGYKNRDSRRANV